MSPLYRHCKTERARKRVSRTLKFMNTNERIKLGMRVHEHNVLEHCRYENRQGNLWDPFLISIEWSNAIERLRKAGKIVWKRHRGGWGGGYKAKRGVRVLLPRL